MKTTPYTTVRDMTDRAQKAWRPEIQGLRAIALLLVAAYHFWLGRVSGGVDVFLFISAFLLTGSFARKLESGSFAQPSTRWGLAPVLAYWLHILKRILPLAAVTVALTLLGTYFFIPAENWLSILDEARAVALYQQNWWSIQQAVDYYAADTSTASPLRHFWSLSLQGQIYLLWPLIFLLVSWAALALGRRGIRPLLILVFTLIFVASLAYSIRETAAHQQTAYFDTRARLWEFALGSLLALLAPSIRLPRALRWVLGWAGILGILTCGLVLDVNGSFPGYVALWPTLSATAVILAGDTQSRLGPEKLLTARPLLALGGISYALYLVHWPLLVFYLASTHQQKAGFWAGLALFALSLALAWALTRLVEKPLRTWALPNRSTLVAAIVTALFLALAYLPSLTWEKSIYQQASKAEEDRATNNVGAAILDSTYEYTGEADPVVIPIRAVLDADWAWLGPRCSEVDPALSDLGEIEADCHYTVRNENPTRRVIVVGNSHQQMWVTALRPIAEAEGWDMISVIRSGCYFGPEDNAAYASGTNCTAYAEAAHSFIQDRTPDTVILQGSRSIADQPDVLLPGIEDRVSTYTASGMTVLGIRDTPRMSQMHKDCLDAFGSDTDCLKDPGQDVYQDPQLPYEQTYPGFGAINLSDLICPENSCPPSIGNIYTYFDYDHITATYIETLTDDYFRPRLLTALDRAEANRA